MVMEPPRIQSDDRGITLNKSLAWTILSALIGAGIWVGTVVAGSQERMISIAKDVTENSARIDSQDVRLRAVENDGSAVKAQLHNIEEGVDRIERLVEDVAKKAPKQ